MASLQRFLARCQRRRGRHAGTILLNLIAESQHESTTSRWREGTAIAIVAVLLRALICGIICVHGHLTLSQYARLYDGNSYIISAEAMGGDRSEFNDYHGRVFPGFPALIALLHTTGLPLPAAAIGIDWISAAAAAVLAARVFNDCRVGWAAAVLIPHYLMNSAMALSEAPLLAFTLAGIWSARGDTPFSDGPEGRAVLPVEHRNTALRAVAKQRITIHALIGGALLGIAGWIRPMACFAMIGFSFAEFMDRSNRPGRRFLRIGIFLVAAGAVAFAGLVLLHQWRGSAFAGLRYAANSPVTYGNQLITWPFHALVTVPIQRHIPVGRVAYIWVHAALALFACGVMLRRFLRRTHPLDFRDALAGPWLWMNTLFALCIGSVWGFECFHRFTIPAMPAMFWAIRGVLPRRKISWSIIAAVSTLVAVLTILHDLPAQNLLR